MSFKEWLRLHEIGTTGTSCVAIFSRHLLARPVTRIAPLPLMFEPSLEPEPDEEEDKPKHKHKKKKH